MKTIKLLLVMLLATALLGGCVYSNIKTPLDRDLDKTEMGTKVGTASTYAVLWLVAWGDGSTAAAAKQGDLKVVNHMDMQVFSLLFGLYAKTTTIVYGN